MSIRITLGTNGIRCNCGITHAMIIYDQTSQGRAGYRTFKCGCGERLEVASSDIEVVHRPEFRMRNRLDRGIGFGNARGIVLGRDE